MEFAKIRTLGESLVTIDASTLEPITIPPWTVGRVPVAEALIAERDGKLQRLAGLTPDQIIQPPDEPEPESEPNLEPAPVPPAAQPRARRTYKRRDLHAETEPVPFVLEAEAELEPEADQTTTEEAPHESIPADD